MTGNDLWISLVVIPLIVGVGANLLMWLAGI